MKFPNLKIQNFLAITEAEISLADRGLVAIQGENNADTSANSNGAGKSSIADALCWCWFGTTARGTTADDVINDVAGKDCMVQSTILDDDGVTYTATRYRKHGTGKNRLEITRSDGLKTSNLTKGTDKLTQVVANQIIGSSLEVFASSIYAGQERMPDLPAMTDKALKVLIEEAAGVTVLEEAYKTSRNDMVVKQTDLSQANSDLDAMRSRMSMIEGQLEGLAKDEKLWEENRAERVREYAGIARDQVNALRSIDAEIANFDEASILSEIASVDAKINSVSEEMSRLQEFRDKISSKKNDIANLERVVNLERSTLSSDKSKRDNLLALVGTPCKECGRDITAAELDTRKNSLDRNMSLAVDSISKNLLAQSQAKTDLSDLTDKMNNFVAGMTDVSLEQNKRAALSQEKANLDAKVAERRAIIEKIKASKERIETVRKENNPYSAQIIKLRGDGDALDTDIKSAKLRVERATVDYETDREVVRVFSPSGVRSRILDEVTPFLNAQTAKYLSTLSDGNISATWTTLVPAAKKGEYKEKFSIEVTNDKGGKSFRTISGGEKRKVRIATALALQDLVATRATKPIDLFIGDEIDDALDKAGLERLMTILEEKTRERGSVFVISHNELSDHIRNILKIEKQVGGQTRITEVCA